MPPGRFCVFDKKKHQAFLLDLRLYELSQVTCIGLFVPLNTESVKKFLGKTWNFGKMKSTGSKPSGS